MNKLPLIGLVVFLSVVQFASVQSADIFDHNLDGRIDIEPVKRPITSSLMPMIKCLLNLCYL